MLQTFVPAADWAFARASWSAVRLHRFGMVVGGRDARENWPVKRPLHPSWKAPEDQRTPKAGAPSRAPDRAGRFDTVRLSNK